jgi:NAD(P)-dependent dehydrogenase (short-subunit alcohol dehydrogenase family)
MRIGRALALRLAADGHDVAVHCRRSQAEAEATATAIRALGRSACIVVADLTRPAVVEGVVPEAVAALGPLDVLVNSAGIFELDRLETLSALSFERHMAVNLRAPLFLAKAFVAQLPEDAEAAIVNLIDERVLNLTPNFLSYSVAKSGLWAATQVLARQLAPRVRVNAIGPGPVVPAPGWTEAQFQALCRKMPLERGASADELADALAFILRTRSMTGQLLTLDGGQQMGWLTPGWAESE